MLKCGCTENFGISVGHSVPLSVSRTYRYVVAHSKVFCTDLAKRYFNVNM